VIIAVGAAVAAFALVARTWWRGYEARVAVIVGVLAAVAALADTRAAVFAVVVALGGLGPLWTRGTVARRYFAWIVQVAIAAAVVFTAGSLL
jgi:divalent metal cation (Fe/Co/Zn/Cd) transporter